MLEGKVDHGANDMVCFRWNGDFDTSLAIKSDQQYLALAETSKKGYYRLDKTLEVLLTQGTFKNEKLF